MKATVLALSALWAGALIAQTPAPPPQHAAHLDHLERLATLLDLTDAQQTQVQAILQEEHAKIRAVHEQAMVSGTQPDPEQMQALHQQITQETLQKLPRAAARAAGICPAPTSGSSPARTRRRARCAVPDRPRSAARACPGGACARGSCAAPGRPETRRPPRRHSRP